MTEYVVLIPGDEAAWARTSDEEKARAYDKHREFAELLAARGHKVTGGAELTPSSTAHVVSGALDDITVTAGPYAETVEQITGFYVIESDDLDDLLKVVGKLAEGEARLEVRECVDHS
jgi:hypothetical protein